LQIDDYFAYTDILEYFEMEVLMQSVLYTIYLSVGSIVVLFILTKLMGYRQMSQLSMFDYINGITIGSIAAEMSVSLDEDFTQPLTAMIIYGIADIILSYLSSKSITARRFIIGKPKILFDNGELYEKNLKKAKIDMNEFLTQCRVSGYFDLAQIQSAVLESNGKISFLPKSNNRPVTPEDLDIFPQKECMVANVIIDGKIMHKNLAHAGKDENWLRAQLKGQGIASEKEVLLGTCDIEGTFESYVKTDRLGDKDILM